MDDIHTEMIDFLWTFANKKIPGIQNRIKQQMTLKSHQIQTMLILYEYCSETMRYFYTWMNKTKESIQYVFKKNIWFIFIHI